MKQYVPSIVAALITSVVVFLAGFVYEGHRMRAVVTTKIEKLTDEVKQLAERVRELEQKK